MHTALRVPRERPLPFPGRSRAGWDLPQQNLRLKARKVAPRMLNVQLVVATVRCTRPPVRARRPCRAAPSGAFWAPRMLVAGWWQLEPSYVYIKQQQAATSTICPAEPVAPLQSMSKGAAVAHGGHGSVAAIVIAPQCRSARLRESMGRSAWPARGHTARPATPGRIGVGVVARADDLPTSARMSSHREGLWKAEMFDVERQAAPGCGQSGLDTWSPSPGRTQ